MRKEERIFMYGQIYALKNKGFNISQIAYETGLSRPTIYKYLDMNLEEIESWCNDLTVRSKKLDPYRARILQWLNQYPHMSSAQIYDWLLEIDGDLDCAESTVRLYVKNIREAEGIIKNPQARSYMAVPEFEPGKQTQVDWGESWQKNIDGGQTKLYFISFVLSYSRYKFAYWLDRPFSTDDGIYAHELALAYFGGMTEEFVYDQDSTISVNENAGDFMLTAAFQAYVETRGIKVRLCKKADPESKGMVESVVKFVKRNFAENRTYAGLEDWNQRTLNWLKRTGNHKVHKITKERPEKMFIVEKKHLLPAHPVTLDQNYKLSITRAIRKDNTILFKSNRYTVPLGTYNRFKDHKLSLILEGDQLLIMDPAQEELLAKHTVCKDHGKLIDTNLHERKPSKSQIELKEKVFQLLGFTREAEIFVGKRWDKYPRHRQEQYRLLLNCIKDYPDSATSALERCISEETYSANSFKSFLLYEDAWKKKGHQLRLLENDENLRYALESAPQRSVDSYYLKLGVE